MENKLKRKNEGRVNAYIKDPKIWHYIEEQTYKYGITKSAFVSMCIGKVMEQDKVMEKFEAMPQMMKSLNEMMTNVVKIQSAQANEEQTPELEEEMMKKYKELTKLYSK